MSLASMHRASASAGPARARAAATPARSASASAPRPPALLLARAAVSCTRTSTTTTTTSTIDRRRSRQSILSTTPNASRRCSIVVAAAAADGASAPPLPAPLQRIVLAFQAVPDPMARYKQLLFYAAKLPGLPEDLRTPENKVEGCVSQVWVVPELREEDGGRVYWRADSDSQLTKGLAALLVTGLSGCTPAEILSVTPEFIEALGLKQSLTPSRNNGFLNMLRKMQRAVLELASKQASA
jgi:sulfur transfer protein SufE